MKTLISIALLLTFITGCSGPPVKGKETYSNGTRVGTIVKFTKKGIFCKTYEGEVNLGGLKKTDEGMVPNLWEFSVDEKDTALVATLQNAAESGSKVSFTYAQVFFPNPCYNSQGYFVQEVKVLE